MADLKTLYVTDLDGTLMRNDQTLSEYTVTTLNRLIGEGFNITYATARSFTSAHKITEDLKIKIPVITRNGTTFADQIRNEETEISRFSPEQLDKLKSILKGLIETRGFVSAYFGKTMNKTYMFGDLCEGLDKYVSYYKNDKRMVGVENYEDLFKGIVTYITIIDEREVLEPYYEKIRKAGDWETVFSKDTYGKEFWLEICPTNATKAKAVQKLKDRLGLDRIVVFGDSVNDLSMFAVADEACAVSNAIDELKKSATKIILSNEEDGVARFIEEDQ